MISKDKHFLAAEALRDFFLAENSDQMEQACQSILLANQIPNPSPADWRELEFSFNQLFIGPGTVIAPPFASVYLEDERFVMGRTTQEVRSLYHMVGLSSPWENIIPDDHIAIELDACLKFHQVISQNSYTELIPVYEHFLQSHLKVWVPEFVAQFPKQAEGPDLIKWIGSQLLGWIEDECEWLTQKTIPTQESNYQNEEKRL